MTFPSDPPDVDSPVATTTSVVRIMNERAVYERLRSLGTATAAQLVSGTGLSKPTVSLAVANLERSGLVRLSGVRTGTPGRAARMYEIQPDAGWVLVVDVGRAWVRLALVDLAGQIVVRRDVRTRARTASTLVAQMGDLAHAIASEAGLRWEQVTRTVIGSPGVYEPESGVLYLCPNLPGWEQPGVVHAIHDRLGDRVTIENDVNLAAIGEAAYGLGRDVRDFVFLSVGTGIGMGLIVDGRLRRGVHGAAGEIGFLPMANGRSAVHPSKSTAWRRGMLEAVAAADAVVARAQARGSQARTAEDVFASARKGDRAAAAAVRTEADLLAQAVAAVVTIVDPQLIVLGGGIGRNGDLLLERMREALARLVPLHTPDIAVSALGNEAVVLGGLAAGLEVAREDVFDMAVSA
jgi:predicted NBD/HSP70 family sugar kinase